MRIRFVQGLLDDHAHAEGLDKQATPRDKYTRNLLNAFLPDGYAEITPQQLHAEFIGLWERFGVTTTAAKNGS